MAGDLAAALWAEKTKLRRSLLPAVTLVAMTLAGLVSGFFMFVLQDVDRARSLGLLGTKAQLTGGSADWAGFFAFAAQVVSTGGLLIFGVVAVWVFGREFADRTAKDLMALPTGRSTIVAAKVLLTVAWSMLLTGYLAALTLVLGTALRLPGWSSATAAGGVGTLLWVGLLSAGLVLSYGMAACAGHGYLAGFAALFVTLVTAQVVAVIGYGAWFPWAVPSLVAGTAGPDQTDPGWASLAIVVVVSVGSAVALTVWWNRADHTS